MYAIRCHAAGRNTAVYKQARRQLLGLPCWQCGRPAFTVDHVPALHTAPHWRLWSGELRPACAHCNYGGGMAYLMGRQGKRRRTNPSRAW
jgi:hypothetical protein